MDHADRDAPPLKRQAPPLALKDCEEEQGRQETMGHPHASKTKSDLPAAPTILDTFIRTGVLPDESKGPARERREKSSGRSADRKQRKHKKSKHNDKGKKKKKKRQASSGSSVPSLSSDESESSSSEDDHKYREWLDQGLGQRTFRDLPDESCDRALRRWKWLNHGRHLPRTIQCSPEQLSALAARFNKRKTVLYADAGIFRPNAKTMREKLQQEGMPGSTLPDGRRRPKLQQPQSYEEWTVFWGCFAMGTEGLDILSPAVTWEYRELIFNLDEEWNSEGIYWYVICEADIEMRSVRFLEYLRRMRRADHPALLGDSFRNGDRRMEALFEQGIADSAFWQEEVEKRVTRLRQKLSDPKTKMKGDHGPLRREPVHHEPTGKRQAVVPQVRTEDKPLTKGARLRANKRARKAGAQIPPPALLNLGQNAPPPPPPPFQQNQGQGKGKGLGKQLGKNIQNLQQNKGKGAGKTGICHNWQRTGSCPRGASCWFAASHV